MNIAAAIIASMLIVAIIAEARIWKIRREYDRRSRRTFKLDLSDPNNEHEIITMRKPGRRMVTVRRKLGEPFTPEQRKLLELPRRKAR